MWAREARVQRRGQSYQPEAMYTSHITYLQIQCLCFQYVQWFTDSAARPPLYSKKQVVSTLPTTSHRASVEQITRREFLLYFSTRLNTFICNTALLLWCNVQATVTYVVSTIRRSTATCNWSAIINKCNNTRGLVILFYGILNKTHQMWGSIICVDSSQRSISPSRSIGTIRRWKRKSEGV